jgi:hypothetical protein
MPVSKLEKIVFICGIKRQLLASYLVLISLEKPSFPNLQKDPRTKLKPLLTLGTIIRALTAKYKVRNLAFSNLFYISRIM